tara:strand:+ start:3709 stop:3894 length:186 start_codon:yes stop_codon:yes gene_type:complete
MKEKKKNTYMVRMTETPNGVVVDSVQQLIEVLGVDREKYKSIDKREFTSSHLNTVTKFTAR